MNTRKHGGLRSRPSVLLIMAIVMAMMVGACADSGAEETTTSAAAEETTTSAAAEETTTSAATEESTTSAAAEPLAVTCEPVAADTEGALIMWERTGGNAQMVDALVCAWNGRNPDRPISLEYIDHTAMVDRLARGLATGDVPDLMGMDLIYGPQFTSAGQLLEVTDVVDQELMATASPGHVATATWEDALYGVPLYADVSALFWNKDLFEAAGLDPETPPTNLTELHDMAAAITGVEDGVYGYYLPGNCAGCNIFTFAPFIWANGGTIEPAGPGDEAMVTPEIIAPVLEWARTMHTEGHIDPAAQAETGATFGEVFGSGNVGIMGTGNFNITLVSGAEGIEGQNPDMNFGVTLLPGFNTGDVASFLGGDIVVIPDGSERFDDAVDFMNFLLTDEVQVEVYAKLLNMTTRTDPELTDNPYYAEVPLLQEIAKAIEIGQTPFTLKFFEMINSPQGPWLQMLQRVYYSDDDINTVIADAKAQMEAIINE